MYKDRINLYEQLEEEYCSKILVYITSDRPNMGAQIGADVIDYFIEHLDIIGDCDRISLYLYTRGGDTAAAWNIINLLRMFCKELQVIVPHKAHSAGTIISLGANEIVMTKQATLSPIDPSVNTPLNPAIQGNILSKYPVSVEAVKGYLEFAKDELGIQDDIALGQIYEKLTEFVHPLVLGQSYRTRAQIQMLATKLLINQVTNNDDIRKITDFLCSESGGHDYTINRREAEKDLKLNIKKPTNKQYHIIKRIYDDISEELQLGITFDPNKINGEYAVRRGLLESVNGGSDYFLTEGRIIHLMLQNAPEGFNEALRNEIIFEGWRHDNKVEESSVIDTEEGDTDVYESTNQFQL